LLTDIVNFFLRDQLMRRKIDSSSRAFGRFGSECPVFLVRRKEMHRIKDGACLYAAALQNLPTTLRASALHLGSRTVYIQ
jgi:hypothetical protein